MGRFSSLSFLLPLAGGLASASSGSHGHAQEPLGSSFDVKACPDYKLYSTYPQ